MPALGLGAPSWHGETEALALQHKGNRMKQYKIFQDSSGNREAVKQGWSWPAFFFSFIWAFAKKQWVLGVAFIIGALVFGSIVGAVGAVGGGEGPDALINIASIVISIVFGMNGNSWREKNLVARGYEQTDTVTAASHEDAVAMHSQAAGAER